MSIYKTILCAVDFSRCSQDALNVAIELSSGGNAALTIAHVWQPPYSTPEMAISGEVVQAIIDDATSSLAKYSAQAKAAGVTHVDTALITGVPWAEIVSVVERQPSFDLIVMGTHGRTGIKHVLIGSVAERVVRHARCAVLVVR